MKNEQKPMPTPKFMLGTPVSFMRSVERMTGRDNCKACSGTGRIILLEHPYQCPVCAGTGGKDIKEVIKERTEGEISGITINWPPRWSNEKSTNYSITNKTGTWTLSEDDLTPIAEEVPADK